MKPVSMCLGAALVAVVVVWGAWCQAGDSPAGGTPPPTISPPSPPPRQAVQQAAASPTGRSGGSATFMVAAADSPSHIKARADYVCGGKDDHLVINAAIQALPPDGGEVRLAAGNYSVGGIEGTRGGICVFRSNVLLAGAGTGTRLRLQDGLSHVNVIWIMGEISDVSVRDLFIDGNGKHQLPWDNKKFGWNGGNGIKAINLKKPLGALPANIKVENCHIENCQVMALMLQGTAVEALNCFFTGTFQSHVIEILGESGRIDGCTLKVRKGDYAGFGFSTDASYNYHIVNNKIFIEPGGTIAAHPINNWPSDRYGKITNLYHGVISGNIVVNNGKTRCVLVDGYMDIVSNNIFRGVPVVLGGPDGGRGMIFEHNILVNSGLEINTPLSGDDCLVYVDGNEFFNSPVKHVAGRTVFGRNPGYATESAGTASVAAGQTSTQVEHGLAAAPKDIQLTPASNLGAASKFWVESTAEKTFTIMVDADPGQTGALFNWRARTGDR